MSLRVSAAIAVSISLIILPVIIVRAQAEGEGEAPPAPEVVAETPEPQATDEAAIETGCRAGTDGRRGKCARRGN